MSKYEDAVSTLNEYIVKNNLPEVRYYLSEGNEVVAYFGSGKGLYINADNNEGCQLIDNSPTD